MSHDVKTWRRFDPESPPRLVGAGGTGAIVAILMSERARRTGWAPHVVRDLVRQWTRTGRRVVLADAAFESPRLHEAFGLSNTTGLSDVLLNRATIQDVARVVRGAGFYFIPAGAGSPDASGHVGRSRWADISRGMLEAGVTLAVVGHVEAAAGLWIAETVTDVVIVSTSDEPLELDEPLDGKIRAVVGLDEPVPFDLPDLGATPGLAFQVVAAAPIPDTEAEDWFAPRARRVPEEATTPLLGDAAPQARASNTVIPRPSGKGPGRGSRVVKHLAWLLPVTVLGVGAALVRIGLLDLPWPLTPEPTTVPTATEPAGPETGPLAGGSPPQVVSDVAVYSVSLGSYQAADFAATRVAALRATVPGVLFTSVPVDVDGDVIHRILAGAVADSASAAALAETVGESLGAPSFEWGLRPTPFAFLVDEHETRADAERTAQELSDLSIPAYVLALDLSDGSTRFRVYVGAFEDAREASHLSTRLESLNVQPAQFTHRAGRAPS